MQRRNIIEWNALQRIFLFIVPELKYQKKDLNLPRSANRRYIGLLTRMITNALFLSHSLREGVVIRIFVQKEKPHVIQIRSDTIRYLGPEERSFASIALKTEKAFEERMFHSFSSFIEEWFEPNPGILVKATENPLINLQEKLEEPVAVINISFMASSTSDSQSIVSSHFSSNSLKDFEEKILAIACDYHSFIFPIALSRVFKGREKKRQQIPPKNSSISYKEYNFSLEKDFDPAKLVTIINLILDKKLEGGEKEKKEGD